MEGLWIFIGILMAGFVTALVIFFLTEAICRRMAPAFFPDGGMTKLPGVFRIHLRTYILMTFFLACFIPMLDLAVLSYNKARMMLVMEPSAVLNSMLELIVFILVVDTGLVVLLSRMISRSVVDPVEDMQNAMERVENGDLTARAAVFANNELGSLADNFNQMTEGLQDRYQIRRSLALAREVQLNLLPEEAPRVEGLDVAGRLIYCDETGGDYYDYLWDGRDPDRIDIVVGDVSGHGIPSALLMSSARAYLRQRRALPGELAQVVEDVNREIARDVQESGRFITLFLLRIDMPKKTLQWVRAGHEPAVLYDAATDEFEELLGSGLPLGVSTNRRYRENRRERFADGQIILLATDGLWESRNPEDEMFGKQRVRSTIRKLASRRATEIRDGLLAALAEFAGDQKPEDDITLVVAKAR